MNNDNMLFIHKLLIMPNNLSLSFSIFLYGVIPISFKYILELGGMTKNLYHGIFLNYTGFTVYDGIYFFHA